MTMAMPSAERAQIERIARELDKAVASTVKTIVRETHRELVAGTPRDTGNLASNWIPAIGAPFDSGPRPLGHSGARTGEAQTVAGLAQLEGYDTGQGPVYISNRTGYASSVILDDNSSLIGNAINAAIEAAERSKF